LTEVRSANAADGALMEVNSHQPGVVMVGIASPQPVGSAGDPVVELVFRLKGNGRRLGQLNVVDAVVDEVSTR
jgi:hypothetical protein